MKLRIMKSLVSNDFTLLIISSYVSTLDYMHSICIIL